MAKKDNSPTISFFSFQDIITSVTGIMFLVVLILILMLLFMRLPSNKKSDSSEKIDELRSEIERLELELAENSGKSDMLLKRVEELRKLDVTSIPQRKNDLLKRIPILDNELAELIEKIKDINLEITENKKIIEQKNKDQKSLEEAMKKAENALQETKDKLEQLEIERRKSANVIKFTLNRNTSKHPLIVECSKDCIKIGSLENTYSVKTFRFKADEQLAELLKAPIAHCLTHSSANTYVILLAKPSSFRYVELFALALDKYGYERGREVLPDDNVTIFEEGKNEAQK